MGGGDQTNITGMVLDSLSMASFNGEVDVVLGAANPNEQLVREQFHRLQLKGQVSKGILNMGERIMAADLGFSALGLTTYEMAYLGLPALIIAGNPLNTEVAAQVQQRNLFAESLGRASELQAHRLADQIASLFLNRVRREQMSLAGIQLIASRTFEISQQFAQIVLTTPTRNSR
jgi:spore coat polysaccharide biosynthesis protein SpsF